jgi:hypothetical protein
MLIARKRFTQSLGGGLMQLCEIKQPLKRRIGMRYSNEFYFVTPAGLLNTSELPIECGLVEVGAFGHDERSIVHAQSGTLVHFEANH